MTTVDPVLFDGVSARTETVRFYVTDAAGNVTGRVYPDADRAPSLRVASGSRIARSIGGLRLSPADAAAVNPAADRLAVEWVIDGTAYPLGRYLWGDVRRLLSTAGTITEQSLLDETFIIAQPIEQGVSLSAGTNVGTAIDDLLATTGVIAYNVDPTSVVLTEPIAWPAGTDLLTILTSLASTAGFLTPYTDNNGVLQVIAAPDLATVTASIDYPAGSVILDESRLETDNYVDAPNRFIVLNNAPTISPVVGVFDVPAAAPYSIAARGFVVARVIDQQGVADFATADAAAYAAYVQSLQQFTSGSCQTPMNPRHDMWTVVSVHGTLYMETGWGVTLSAGSVQSHDLRRIYQ